MSNKKVKHEQQQAQGNHEDCEDCRRQKKENEALISIYEKLQVVNNRAKAMRSSVDAHQESCRKTHTKFDQFVSHFNSLPKQSKTNVEIKNLGNEMAREMVEEAARGAAKKQNQRLKNILIRMHRQRDQNKTQNGNYSFDWNRGSDQRYNQPEIRLQQSELATPRSTRYRNHTRQISFMGEKIHEEVEPEDTITTGFFSTKNRSTLSRNANKFDELNLWLYDADQNKNLEEEFYETMANTKMMGHNSTARVKNGRSAVLPAISGRRK